MSTSHVLLGLLGAAALATMLSLLFGRRSGAVTALRTT